MDDLTGAIRRALSLAVREAIDPNAEERLYELDANIFIRAFKADWYYRSGMSSYGSEPDFADFAGSFFILSQKNASVTDLFYNEIEALVRANLKIPPKRQKSICIGTDYYITTLLRNAINEIDFFNRTHIESKFSDNSLDFIEHFRAIYADLFKNSIIIEPYFTSVLIHIPNVLKCDMISVVAMSGYAHSAGLPLYIRNAEKAEQHVITKRLDEFLANLEEGKKIFFTAYAEELFSDDEKVMSPASVRNGLDGIRLHLRKHYIEGTPLLDYVAFIQNRFQNKIFVPQGIKNYKTEKIESKTVDDCTIWMITDGGIADSQAGIYEINTRDKYLILYAQYFRNANPLHTFKERKLGWCAPITIPHTLSGALINLAGLDQHQNEQFVFIDPFCGTGTTILDAAIRYPDACILGFDRNPLFPRLVQDNAHFFSYTPSEISNLETDLRAIVAKLENYSPSFLVPYDDLLNAQKTKLAGLKGKSATEKFLQIVIYIYSGIMNYVDVKSCENSQRKVASAIKRMMDEGFGNDIMQFLNDDDKCDLRTRCIFYIVWRAIAQKWISIQISQENLDHVIKEEINRTILELEDHYEKTSLVEDVRWQGVVKGAFSVSKGGSYSAILKVQSQKFYEILKKIQNVKPGDVKHIVESKRPGVFLCKVDDSLDLMRNLERSVDHIVCDPPYGYNIQEGGAEKMAEFFRNLLPTLIGSITNNGSISIAIPRRARNGRTIPFHQTFEWLDLELRRHCMNSGIRLRNEIRAGNRHAFWDSGEPNYWRSTSSLDRSIVKYEVE
jgi:hypothetical protein